MGIIKGPRSRIGYLLSVLVFLPLFSCGLKQDVYLRKDGSGTVSFSVVLKPVLLDYLKEMGELAENGPDQVVFNLDEIRKGLSEKPGIIVQKLTTPAPSSLEGSLLFSSLDDLFKSRKELSQAGVVVLNHRSDGSTEVKVHLTRENFRQIPEVLAMKDNPLFEMFGPQVDDDSTRQEYLDMVEYALGEAGPVELLSSSIEVLVTIEGTVLSQSGGKLVKGGVLYKIPLIKVLRLEEPLDFSLIFK